MTTAAHELSALQRPAMADVDVCGLTHPGKVRQTNADQFLIASFHRALHVHATSISGGIGAQETGSRGFLLLVADGVGGLSTAAEGSAHAVTTVAQHLLHATELCSQVALSSEQDAVESLRDAVLTAHRGLLEAAAAEGMPPAATTLTMYAAFWPRAFVLHVGDSRMYRLRDGVLERLTTDQTFAQMMVQAGALSPAGAESSHLKHVLWSALGTQEIVPEVVITDCTRRGVVMLCTDGLTNHVSDDEIREHLARGQSAEQACQGLIDLALERGGRDNVTVVIGQVKPESERRRSD
jgi:protein phosphatase